MPASPWRSLTSLVDEPDGLRVRIARVREGLAGAAQIAPEAVEERVAASVAQLGLCARVLAPVFGQGVVSGSSYTPELADLWWQDELGGPFPLSIPEPAASAGELVTWVRFGPIAALTDAVSELVPVSPQVLWGNVASAVNSAANGIAAVRPDLADRARTVAGELLADEVLNPSGSAAGPSFRRASCCLIYRVASSRAAICGDCVLHDTVRTVT